MTTIQTIYKKVLLDIERIDGPYDPLIIKLKNNNMFWNENSYTICCREHTKIDENYITKTKVKQQPNSLFYNKRCELISKIKYVLLRIE